MKLDLTAAVWKEGPWYVSQCVELDIASQGRTEKSALKNLEEAVLLYLQDDKTGEIRRPVSPRKIRHLTVTA